MGFVKALFTLLITTVVYAYFTYPIVIAIGVTLAVCFILTVVTEKLNENFYITCAYLVITSAILTLICTGVNHVPSRVAVWVIANIHLLGAAASFLVVFARDIYDKNVASHIGEYDYAQRYARHMIKAPKHYAIKWLILASPLIIVQIILISLVKDNPSYGFINSGVYLLVGILFYIVMKIKGIEPEVGTYRVKSFSDLPRAIGSFFTKPGKEFVGFFAKLGRFFKRLFTGELFKRKPKTAKVEKEKSYKAKKSVKSLSLRFNSYALFFAIPVVICALTFLFCELGWFDGGENFFAELNDKVNFVDGYGKWWDAFGDWFRPIVNDWFFLFQILAFILQLPIMIICYVLEGAWWLISWLLIGIVKLFILLIGNIVFVIPFILFGGGVVMDVILLNKCDDKDASIVVGFIISLLLCLVMGLLIIF